MQWREMGCGARMGVGAFLVAIILTMAAARSAFAQPETVTVNIPPQELSTALTALADQTNMQVLYASELTRGLTTNGVAGTVTPQDAVRQLLEGSGLAFTFTDGKTVTLQKAPIPATMSQTELSDSPEGSTRQKAIKVPEIVVKEARERGYVADESTSATRIPVPIEDVPRSIEVVTREVIDDQKVIRMSDALRNVSGTSMPITQGGRAGGFMIRGFLSDLNVFKNGFREDSTFGARASRDVANLQSIEVVKGPPSYLFGRADPGGLINQITKDPLRSRYYSGDLIFGSYNLYRPTMDIGGPLNDSRTLAYRLNGVYESAESYREGVKTERIFLAPTFGWEISSQTTFRFEGEYLYDKSPIDRGLVAVGTGPANIPIGRFLGDATQRGEINQGKATMTLLHQVNDVWKLRSAFRAAVASEKYNSLESWFMDDATGILQLARFQIPQLVQSYYWQNEAHGNFSTGSVKHKLLMGVEVGRESSSQQQFSDTAGAAPLNTINIYNPVYSFVGNPLELQSDTSNTNGIIGIYAGDHISLLENLHLHAGGRFDIFEQKVVNRPSLFSPSSTEKESTNHFSPSVGLNYQPIKPVAIFANYTQSFAPQPVISRQLDGQLAKPETGEQIEGGFKFQAFEGKLRSTLAAFNIKKKNVLTADVSQGPGSGFSIAVGEQRSQGVEFDIVGQVFPGLDIIANYAYIDTRVTEDNTFAVGSRLPNAALNQGSIWAKYIFQEGVVKGFGGGLGMYAQSNRQGIFQCQDPSACQQQFDLAGYVRMDAALYYRKPEIYPGTNLLAALNFTNLLDQRYMAGAQNFREIIYTGAPLTVIGSLKLEFN